MGRQSDYIVDEYMRRGLILAKSGNLDLSGGDVEYRGLVVFDVVEDRLPKRRLIEAQDLTWIGKTLRDTLMRYCASCNSWYPATPAFWHKDRRGRDGYHSKCYFCRKEERNNYYQRTGK